MFKERHHLLCYSLLLFSVAVGGRDESEQCEMSGWSPPQSLSGRSWHLQSVQHTGEDGGRETAPGRQLLRFGPDAVHHACCNRHLKLDVLPSLRGEWCCLPLSCTHFSGEMSCACPNLVQAGCSLGNLYSHTRGTEPDTRQLQWRGARNDYLIMQMLSNQSTMTASHSTLCWPMEWLSGSWEGISGWDYRWQSPGLVTNNSNLWCPPPPPLPSCMSPDRQDHLTQPTVNVGWLPNSSQPYMLTIASICILKTYSMNGCKSLAISREYKESAPQVTHGQRDVARSGLHRM